jgi:transposase
MHLDFKTSKYHDKVYKYYYIAEAYRTGHTVKKKALFTLGKLNEEQAKKIKLICKTITKPDEEVTTLRSIVAQECVNYLDVAIVNALWEKWQLNEAFKFDCTKGPLTTSLIAKILTINRCLEPCSHYSIPHWTKTTALPDILGSNILTLNDDKIYYELLKIYHNKPNIENHLFKKTYEDDPKSYDYVDYDLSTSYFVGMKCKLSEFGISKDKKPNCKQVVLTLLINSHGYPFQWDVYPGNTAEIDTMDTMIKSCANRFKLKNISLVFDRGLVSDDTLELTEDKKLKYITALDSDQIQNVPHINLSQFQGLRSDNALKQIPKLSGFMKYDNTLYYEQLPLSDHRRYIVGINPDKFIMDRKIRKEKIECFQLFLLQLNKSLKKAKRDRKEEVVRSNIIIKLKRLKIKKYYEEPVLKQIYVTVKLKNGTIKKVLSYQADIKQKKEKIAKEKLLDGLCVFITNHFEKKNGKYLLPTQRIIKAYRVKTQIEDAFKNIKSFIKIRPFFVNKDEHVQAVYAICVLSYFINRYLANKRLQSEEKFFLNSKQLYEPFKNCKLITFLETLNGLTKKDIIPLSDKQKEILSNILPEKSFMFKPVYTT